MRNVTPVADSSRVQQTFRSDKLPLLAVFVISVDDLGDARLDDQLGTFIAAIGEVMKTMTVTMKEVVEYSSTSTNQGKRAT